MGKKIIFENFYYQDEQCKKFYAIFRDLSKLFGCYYMGYIYEEMALRKRVGFTTNPDLQSVYIGNNLISICHLWNTVSNYFASTNAKYFILPWEIIKPSTNKQKEIILYREELHIGRNGISFCSRNYRFCEYLYFAPEIKDTGFINRVAANISLIRKKCSAFRQESLRNILTLTP